MWNVSPEYLRSKAPKIYGMSALHGGSFIKGEYLVSQLKREWAEREESEQAMVPLFLAGI